MPYFDSTSSMNSFNDAMGAGPSASASAGNMFGVVVPGRSVITDFQVVDQTKAITMIEQPTTIPDLSFFLLPSAPIPLGYGVIIYYAIPPFQNWEILGSVSLDKPSAFFRTGWTTKEDLVGCPVLQLGVSIEP